MQDVDIRLPLFSHKVAAGFPSPADDYIQGRLSLDEHLIQHRESTFFVRAKGNCMTGAGIAKPHLSPTLCAQVKICRFCN